MTHKPTISNFFDSTPHRELNEDHAALCHEITHAVVWYHSGQAIGRMKITRSPKDKLLEPRVALLPRTGDPRDLQTINGGTSYAERMLAGDFAARIVAHLPTNQISTFGLLKADGEPDGQHDLAELLTVAAQIAGKNYTSWLNERLRCAASIVRGNWVGIENIANRLRLTLPRPGAFACIAGTTLIALMRRQGVQSQVKPPVEVVFNGSEGRQNTQARRNRRLSAGDERIECIYIAEPTNRSL